jgi:YVTN family beta-propeller protein
MCGRQIKLFFHKSFCEAYNNRELTMKFLFSLTLILFLIPALQAQQVINNILLPDSLGSMPDGAYSCVYNEANNCIYVGGQDAVFVLDGATDQKIARIPVTGSVTNMLWIPGENKIFCAQYDDAKVTVIDGASNSVVTTIPVGIYPICLVYNATNNKVYCANKHSRDITVIDAASNSVITTMLFPDEACDMVWRAIDNTLWCVGGEWYYNYYGDTNIPWYGNQFANWDISAIVWNATDNKIYTSDWASNSVNGSITVGDKPVDLVWNATGDKVYCANYSSDDVSVIDGVTNNVIATIPAGDAPAGLCWNSVDNKVYCLNSGSANITVIDGVSDTVITTVQVRSINFSYSSSTKPHLAINSLKDKLYFPQENEREVRVIDGSSNNILEDVRLGTSPWALVWNTASDKLYSINHGRNSSSGGGGSISIIDGVNQAPLTTLTVGSHPSGVVWNSTNNTVYCANRGSDNVSVIDGISDQIIDTIAVGGQPNAILLNATSNKIYTANSSGNSVSIIDGATHTLLTTVPAGIGPWALTLNSTNNKIYCSNRGSQNVTVIDGFSNSVIATIPVYGGPKSILWNATSNKIYSAGGSTVSIIDGVMDTVITNVSTGYVDLINLTWNATNNKVYCGGEFEYIAIIDGESNQITNTILIESTYHHILDLFWNSLDNRLYCFALDYGVPSYQRPGKLFVIDGVTDSIITRLSLPGGRYESLGYYTPPGFFAVDMQHNRIFLANFYDGSISVIDPTATGIIPEPLSEVPERFLLQQNYPNPFNPSTVISWQLAVGNQVKLTVYNITGQRVAILVNERQPAGSHSVKFDASGLASGVYLYRLEAGGFVENRKMVLMR